MENQKQFKVVRYIPTLVVEWAESGNQDLVVSPHVYDDAMLAKTAMFKMLDLYSDRDCQVIRYCISCKVFKL